MSIKIHHGPPGSYKTSGAVMDDFIPAAKSGRPVVTNVRGLSDREQCVKALGDLPEGFQIFHIDTSTQQGRDSLARFFHWVPHGAFILIDEAQMVFPLIWKDSDLKKLDYPGGLERSQMDNRPPNFLLAFEMHRHYGWDIVLTTPNIDKIRKDIRGCSEGAYKHKNQALIGFKGSYLEAFHLAEDSGKSASDFLSVRNRKIKKQVWSLYASTATGTHSDTIAGTPLWKNPRVLFFLVFLAALAVFLGTRKTPNFIDPHTTIKDHKKFDDLPGEQDSVQNVAVGAGHVPTSKARSVSAVIDVEPSPFDGYQWRIFASHSKIDGNIVNYQVYFMLTSDSEELRIKDSELSSYGYSYKYFTPCHIQLTYKTGKPFHVYCTKSLGTSKTYLASVSSVIH